MNIESRIKKNIIKSFTDLVVWQEGHKFVLEIYKVTKTFPKDERWGLSNQLRRAVVSVTSNIAEGFSRGGYKEKCQFYYLSLGSLTEVQNQLIVARDVGYINRDVFFKLADKSVEVQKLLNKFISCTKDRI